MKFSCFEFRSMCKIFFLYVCMDFANRTFQFVSDGNSWLRSRWFLLCMGVAHRLCGYVIIFADRCLRWHSLIDVPVDLYFHPTYIFLFQKVETLKLSKLADGNGVSRYLYFFDMSSRLFDVFTTFWGIGQTINLIKPKIEIKFFVIFKDICSKSTNKSIFWQYFKFSKVNELTLWIFREWKCGKMTDKSS